MPLTTPTVLNSQSDLVFSRVSVATTVCCRQLPLLSPHVGHFFGSIYWKILRVPINIKHGYSRVPKIGGGMFI